MDRTLIWQLAFRYLRGKRSANAVPILSRISMVAIAVSSAAMIMVFSVFNGLESVVKDMYKAFYPDIRITVARGKFFQLDTAKLNTIKHINGVRNMTTVLEDNVFVNNNNQQKVITLKGIDNNYFNVNEVTQYIEAGDDSVSAGQPYTAIVGQSTMKELAADVNNIYSYIELLYVNPAVTNPEANPLSAFQSLKLHPAGVFRIGDEFDGKYILAPLSLVQNLFFAKGRYSSIEISAVPGAVNDIKKQLEQLLGAACKVETRYEQNKSIYLVMSAEKWAIYAILVLVLLIASFNLVGALSMLVLEKQKDIAILKAMGAQSSAIRKIFLLEGVLWAMTGGIAGILLGAGVSLLQQKYGFVKVGGAFLIDAYPVKLKLSDFALVFVTILLVGLLTAWYPSMRATKVSDPTLKST
ncbi:MAG: ABC transporter permease [Chitinophagales bacterium]